MFKKAIIIGVSVLSVSFAGIAFASGIEVGRHIMMLPAGAMGKVFFTHEDHQFVLKDCNACHRLFPQEKGAIQELIGDGLLVKKQVMNDCINCHKKTKAKGKHSGPISCGGCHKNKKFTPPK